MNNLLLIIGLMLVVSAFFSGMEIAFLSSNRLRIELDRKQGKVYAYIADIFLKHPGQFISTLLVGNNIALVTYGIYTSRLLEPVLERYFENHAYILLINTLLSTGLILFAGEFLPKAIFRLKHNAFLRVFIIPLAALYIIFYPISKFSSWFSMMILKVVGVKIKRRDSAPVFDKVDLVNLINESKQHEDEGSMHDLKIFQNALDFSEVKVRDRMIPRIDMRAIDESSSIDELKLLFVETNFSRIPVYRNTVDNIVGYVNSKDLFKRPTSIKEMLLNISLVPETMPAQRLLTRFIREHKSLAIVVDEFGGTAGLVTIEDIIEEIVGDIEDEHDAKDTVEKRLKSHEFIFSGKLKVEDLNEKYDLGIPETDDYDTIAGYILFNTESIPSNGDVIQVGRFKFKILRMSSNRIMLVHLAIKE